MAFLTPSELNTVATQEVITLITGSDAIVSQIIAESIDLMKSYLNRQYNTDAIFSATGNDRALIVLKYLKDITVHEVYTRRSKGFNEVAKTRYNEAMLWLEKISKMEITPDLPRKQNLENNTPDTFLKLGSNKKYDNHF